MITDDEAKRRIESGRNFMHMEDEDPDYLSDQYKKLPQPPLFKDAVSEVIYDLPLDFEGLMKENDLLKVINSRKSHRVYTEEDITLSQLSFLLWCAQGVKDMRGKRYATLRTVPGGGARHEFELYMAVNHVEGLKKGFYHYLPQHHRLECLKETEDLKEFLGRSLAGQNWAEKSSVVFYFDMVAYRAEWRYGIYTHRMALVDAGYPSENIYLAATALGLGSCALGAIYEPLCNEAFGLDGKEEFIFMAHSLGTISEKDAQKEKDFYSFVHDYE